MQRAILLSLSFFVVDVAIAQGKPIVLHCQPDNAPEAMGLRLRLDTSAGTMEHLFPGEAKPLPLPMREIGSEWIGEMVLDKEVGDLKAGSLLLSVAVDQYTLRFRMYNRLAEAFKTLAATTVGQCRRLEKQL